jgi:hypothetical protein
LFASPLLRYLPTTFRLFFLLDTEKSILGEMEFCSPALSVNSDMTDEELDKYFASCGSLSNLPTPPPAKEHHNNTTRTSSSQTETGSSAELQGTFHTSFQVFSYVIGGTLLGQ